MSFSYVRWQITEILAQYFFVIFILFTENQDFLDKSVLRWSAVSFGSHLMVILKLKTGKNMEIKTIFQYSSENIQTFGL
jgi:hypothetical protein